MTTEKCESDDKENVEANISAEEPNRNMKQATDKCLIKIDILIPPDWVKLDQTLSRLYREADSQLMRTVGCLSQTKPMALLTVSKMRNAVFLKTFT